MAALLLLLLLLSALLLLGTQFAAVQTQMDEYNPDTHLSTVSAACLIEVASQIASMVTVRLGNDPHDAKQILVMTHGASTLTTKCICLYHLFLSSVSINCLYHLSLSSVSINCLYHLSLSSVSVIAGPEKQDTVSPVSSFGDDT